MEAFFSEVLDGFPNGDFLEKVREKYHYEETRLGELQAVAGEMLPLMRREAFWEVRTPWIWNCGGKEDVILTSEEGHVHYEGAVMTQERAAAHYESVVITQEKADTRYEGVVMTLGTALDALQESYHKKGMLTESYILEVLSGELLLQGYRAYNNRVKRAGVWHVARYHFPGSEKELSLDMLPHMLSRFSLQVSCNDAYCMLPRKSVVFLAELTQDHTIACEGICVGCGSVNCPNRVKEEAVDFPLTYGYQRIFGKWQ